MTWMPTFLENRSDVDFTGYDIVQANVENHKANFADKNWKFEVYFVRFTFRYLLMIMPIGS